LKVVFINDRTWGSAPLADYIPTTLKRAGIDVQQRAAETASHDQDLRDGNYDIAWRHLANEKPLVRLPAFFESKGVFTKAAGISDPEMDRLIDQLRSAGAMEEQKRLVRRLAEIQVEKVYAANVGDPAFFRGEQKWFKAYDSFYTAQAAPGASLWYLWLDQDLMPAKRKR
jgi:ABC-type oligopeptide transport system substrate-binding subunit